MILHTLYDICAVVGACSIACFLALLASLAVEDHKWESGREQMEAEKLVLEQIAPRGRERQGGNRAHSSPTLPPSRGCPVSAELYPTETRRVRRRPA